MNYELWIRYQLTLIDKNLKNENKENNNESYPAREY